MKEGLLPYLGTLLVGLLGFILRHILKAAPKAPGSQIESHTAPQVQSPTAPPKRPPARPAASTDPVGFSEETVFALTIWAEARGEPKEGQEAVAHVILNRAKNPGWWGRDVKGVCLKPYQFSCWLPSDPNRKRLVDPATRTLSSYAGCLQVARDALTGVSKDPTGGCDHYCTTTVASKTKWAKDVTPVTVIGHHNFYRLGKG